MYLNNNNKLHPHKLKQNNSFTETTQEVAECALFCRRLFVKKVGKISIKYANMSNKLLVKKQVHRILTWFFSYDKLTKLKTASKGSFNNKPDD